MITTTTSPYRKLVCRECEQDLIIKKYAEHVDDEWFCPTHGKVTKAYNVENKEK